MSEADDEDVKWVARCLRGDSTAFEPLVTRHQRVLFSVALRLVGNYEDARDATQNAFIRAYERLETFDLERKFFSWIYRIAVNECLNLRRGRRSHESLDVTIEAASPRRDTVEAAELEESFTVKRNSATYWSDAIRPKYNAANSVGTMTKARNPR